MKNPISQGKVVLMLLVGCLEIFSLIPPCSRPPRIPLNSTKKYHQHAPTTVVMRLITHNMLKSNVKGVINGFPLRIEAEKVEVKETEFNSGTSKAASLVDGRHRVGPWLKLEINVGLMYVCTVIMGICPKKNRTVP